MYLYHSGNILPKNPEPKKPEAIILRQALSKAKYKYVSEHIWPQDDFQFNFMKGRHSEHFPESRVKVIQAGGYTLLETGEKKHVDEDANKIIVFTTNAQTDISFLTGLQTYSSLNVYQGLL
jgi:hypothetical protein